ncbi:uncharacterized protein K452DRAFT_349074 [Aplosporella prunicola CBS 121167]|uniref:HORMA domain-containing protein n=1 Tax=Aplosporella prunicola CBS 121167 TaxID=1176127 RepID=A0A6A6BPD0_9PEZI|nr:uncharacterized protein K452DRAFT_349074 [Aplosporella prunicola CBS 121167]KAF2145558.1 hypothetical protein K452DRAFT_349074 [Aplosporella prunicola CBS 121167]
MPPNGPPPTFASLVAAFSSFLTVAVHTILHHRSLYPRTSFLTARAYNYPVHQNRHPQVCTWVSDAIAAVEAELFKGTVARVALVIYSASCKPLERFMWDVSRFPIVPRADFETPFASSAAEEDVIQDKADLPADLEEQFRGALAKLAACESKLKPLPPGCTFTIAVELRETADPPVGHPQPWIPVEPNLQATKSGGRAAASSDNNGRRRGEDLGGVKTMPVRAVDAGEMVFEMWIEEGKAKMEIDEENTSSAEAA